MHMFHRLLRIPCPGEYVSEEVSLAVVVGVVVVVVGQRAPSRRTSLPHTLQKRHSALLDKCAVFLSYLAYGRGSCLHVFGFSA